VSARSPDELGLDPRMLRPGDLPNEACAELLPDIQWVE
jgi:hypothetical protein